MKTIAVAGTFDSKGEEFRFVKNEIEKRGFRTFTIHTGVFEPLFEPDVSNKYVAMAAGVDINEIVKRNDRGYATKILSQGLKELIPALYKEGLFDGIISMGGTGGTSIISPALRELPLGVPKVVVSTMASRNVEPYVGCSDIVMMPSIVDVAGLNAISMKIYQNAVYAVTGMTELSEPIVPENLKGRKPMIAATMFGVTTPCVVYAKEYLEERGYDVLVFHANGTGGRTMESMIEKGYFAGVLDITTTEWTDELFNGIMAGGQHRLEAASLNGVPQVLSLGAVEFIDFGPESSVPKEFLDRKLYRHNPTITVMRANESESKIIGEKLVEKMKLAKKNTALMIPLKGLSMVDAEGNIFYGPAENKVLFDTIKDGLKGSAVDIYEYNNHINDREFAESCAKKLIELIENRK